MSFLNKILLDAIHLFYPSVCLGCGSDTIINKQLLCLNCINALPHTGYASLQGNALEKIFTGRLPVSAAHSEFYFSKGKLVQHLIHELKYKSNKDIGHYMGEMMGKTLLQSGRFSKIDYLVPLPLFPEKEFKRGYNQSEIICNGLSAVMNIPVLKNNVLRKHATETQTRKHRAERWENVAESFLVKHPEKITGKHILLVDDVVTTGATLEACGQVILKAQPASLSFACLAKASK
ncbi:MAG: phosphoribosyltransferase family protein [Ferruginibacter sp.]